MISLGLLHCDENGSRIDGKTWWVHDASDQNYTYLTIHQKRGQIGRDAADVLPHAIRCAHLFRELNGVIENHPEQTWAARFKKLLLTSAVAGKREQSQDASEAKKAHRNILQS